MYTYGSLQNLSLQDKGFGSIRQFLYLVGCCRDHHHKFLLFDSIRLLSSTGGAIVRDPFYYHRQTVCILL